MKRVASGEPILILGYFLRGTLSRGILRRDNNCKHIKGFPVFRL